MLQPDSHHESGFSRLVNPTRPEQTRPHYWGPAGLPGKKAMEHTKVTWEKPRGSRESQPAKAFYRKSCIAGAKHLPHVKGDSLRTH